MPRTQTLTVGGTDAGQRLDVLVCGALPDLSRSRVRRLIDSADVTLNGRPAKAGAMLRAGDTVRVNIPDPEPATPVAQAIPLTVVYEDADLAVIDKPPGMVVHPGAGAPDGTMVNALLARDGTLSAVGGVFRPGIVHRLDKDTSGLIVVARNDASHRALSAALAERTMSRVYWALALRRFRAAAGEVEAPIGRHPGARTRMAVVDHGRRALTRWKVLEQMGGVALVECRLATGRTHQIRVHLAHINHPVLGDATYGGAAAVAAQCAPAHDTALRALLRGVARQMLHARELAFAHPRTGEPMRFVAEPPADFASLLAALRAAAAD